VAQNGTWHRLRTQAAIDCRQVRGGEANPDNFNGFIYPDGHLAGTVTMKNGIGVDSWNVS